MPAQLLKITGIVLVAGCADKTTAGLEPTPAEMIIVSGNAQTAPPGTELPAPVVVKVTDANGTGIANQIVNFRVVSGGGSVFAGVAKTNATGIAKEFWTLGSQAGEQKLEARAVDGGTGGKLVYASFTATAGTPPPTSTVASVVVTPATASVEVSKTVQLSAAARDAQGTAVSGATITWATLNPGLASVSTSGLVTGIAAGTARITAASDGKLDTATVTVAAAPAPTPPPSGDAVVYPSAAVAFVAGPQIRSGSAANPWPWFDSNAITSGKRIGNEFLASPTFTHDDVEGRQYYDQALAQYINYYRTGDAAFQNYARRIADAWWAGPHIRQGAQPVDNSLDPRQAAFGGLVLRALEGRPEMWPWLTAYVRYHYDIWLGWRLNMTELHYGVRDGGFTLLHVAWLAKVHPDAAVRAEMQDKALRAARDYYARLQYADGSWRWRETPGDGSTPYMQPFMIGMLLEGLIATHQLTNDATVRTAILRGVDNLYLRGYRTDSFTSYGGGRWRGMWYTVYGSSCATPRAPACGEGEPMSYSDKIREVRQLNPVNIHAFGYAYKLTGDVKYRTQGDEIFAATFGKGQGPGADAWYGLADFRPKEYNQSYRSAGRYLAWRAGF